MSNEQNPDAIFTELAQKVGDLVTQITAFSATTTPDEFRRALDDQLAIYGLTAQIAEVITQQRDQIQALTEAYTAQSQAVKDAYDRMTGVIERHDTSSADDRAELHDLMSAMHLLLGSLLSVARSQMRHLNDIGRAVGADQVEAELRRLKDIPPEDKEKPSPAGG